MGNKNINKSVQLKGVATHIARALNNTNNQRAFKRIKILRAENKSFNEIAKILNKEELKTSRNKEFQKGNVKQLYDRFKKYEDLLNNKKEVNLNLKQQTNTKIGTLKKKDENVFEIENKHENFRYIDFIPFNIKTNKFAYNKINNFVSSAKKEIMVCNYLYPKLKLNHENDPILSEYFSNITNVFLKEDNLTYCRVLQLPYSSTIFNRIRKYYNNAKRLNDYSKYTIGNSLLAIFLLPKETRKHILDVFSSKKSNLFSLHILPVNRTHSTHMTIDKLTYVREDYITNAIGISRPNDITIIRAKKYDTKNNEQNEIAKMQINECINDMKNVLSKTTKQNLLNEEFIGFTISKELFFLLNDLISTIEKKRKTKKDYIISEICNIVSGTDKKCNSDLDYFAKHIINIAKEEESKINKKYFRFNKKYGIDVNIGKNVPSQFIY